MIDIIFKLFILSSMEGKWIEEMYITVVVYKVNLIFTYNLRNFLVFRTENPCGRT